MVRYSNHPEKYPFEKRYKAVRDVVKQFAIHCRMQWNIEGIEYLNKAEKPVVIIANHLSMMDIVCLIAISERPITFVAKKEVYKYPFVGRCLKSIDGLFLDRSDLRQNVKIIGEAVSDITSGKCSIGIYPEGTRLKNLEEKTGEFHPGSLKIAVRSKADIVCLAEYGTFRPLPKELNYKSYPIQFKFFEPISFEEYGKLSTTELSTLLHDKVAEEVERMKVVDKEYMDKKLYKKKLTYQWWRKYFDDQSR
ncbi:MAG: 1-acyl-sn-glycerol-3-phosphate acyltransferase [Bacilli bacterium]|nr:1-acyl-sn-glycerol-3-phosphate acyltransferase [Bacilli bacterium]